MTLEILLKTENQIQNSLNYLGDVSVGIDIFFSLKNEKQEFFWIVKNKKIKSVELNAFKAQKNNEKKLYQYRLTLKLWKKLLNKVFSLDDLMFGGHININQGVSGYSSLFHKLIKNLDNKKNLILIKETEEKKFSEEIEVKYENKKYRIKKYCPHQFYSLEGAEIKDGIITCPAHGWKFCIKNGNCIKGDKKKNI